MLRSISITLICRSAQKYWKIEYLIDLLSIVVERLDLSRASWSRLRRFCIAARASLSCEFKYIMVWPASWWKRAPHHYNLLPQTCYIAVMNDAFYRGACDKVFILQNQAHEEVAWMYCEWEIRANMNMNPRSRYSVFTIR